MFSLKEFKYQWVQKRLKQKAVPITHKDYIFDSASKTGELKRALLATTLFDANDLRLKIRLKRKQEGLLDGLSDYLDYL